MFRKVVGGDEKIEYNYILIIYKYIIIINTIYNTI